MHQCIMILSITIWKLILWPIFDSHLIPQLHVHVAKPEFENREVMTVGNFVSQYETKIKSVVSKYFTFTETVTDKG